MYRKILFNSQVVLFVLFTLAMGGRFTAYLTKASMRNIKPEAVSNCNASYPQCSEIDFSYQLFSRIGFIFGSYLARPRPMAELLESLQRPGVIKFQKYAAAL
jgi:hypothetical protein